MQGVRLGELLVREGVIRPAQLDMALELHRRSRERLGTCLIELGLVSADMIARALAVQQNVPAVLAQHVAAIDPQVIALLPVRVAGGLNAIPLGYTQSRPSRLLVALRDPHTTPLEEIGFIAGMRVERAVAPETRIRECLARYYGVKSEARISRSDAASWNELDLEDRDPLSVAPPTVARQPSAPPPATRRHLSAPPPATRRHLSVPPPTVAQRPSVPPPAAARPSVPPAMFSSEPPAMSRRSTAPPPAALELSEPFDLTPPPRFRTPPPPSVSVADADAPPSQRSTAPPPRHHAMLAEPAPAPEPVVAAATRHSENGSVDAGWDDVMIAPPEGEDEDHEAPEDTAPPSALTPFLDLEAAIAALRAATTRDAIGDALVAWLQSTYGCGVVLIVKEGRALGWKGYAPDAEQHEIEWIGMPLAPASLLKQAYDGKVAYRGAPPAEGAALHERMWQLLHCAPPREIIVGPVLLGGRVINLLYAHRVGEGGDLPASAIEDMSRVASVAATEYARLIRKR